MEIRTFNDVPVGALVRALRQYRRTESKTLWAIKAKQTASENQERISLFWLESLDDDHPVGFDFQCPENVLFVCPSLKIVADMETSEFHPKSGDLIRQFCGLIIAGGPCFLGGAFNQDGDLVGDVICTLEGKVSRTEETRAAAASSVTVPNWHVESSDEPKLVHRQPR